MNNVSKDNYIGSIQDRRFCRRLFQGAAHPQKFGYRVHFIDRHLKNCLKQPEKLGY